MENKECKENKLLLCVYHRLSRNKPKKITFNIEYVVASVLRQANLVPQDGGVFTLGLTHLNS